MNGRRRTGVGAVGTMVMLLAGCGGSPAPDVVTANEGADPSTSTVAAFLELVETDRLEAVDTVEAEVVVVDTTVAPFDVPDRATTTTTTTTTATTTNTNTPGRPCGGVDVVVLGNSTDYWPNFVVGADGPTDDAWPAILEDLLAVRMPGTPITVENGSVLGAGFDRGLYGVISMRDRLDELVAVARDRATVLIVAPSVVDLQLRSLDVDASLAAFEELLAHADGSFEPILILPMNPVATGFDPAVAAAIAAFNDRLVADGLIGPSDTSPLLSDDATTGRPEFYDDFDDGRTGTAGPDPDRLHPDADGHAAIAAAVADRLVGSDIVICH